MNPKMHITLHQLELTLSLGVTDAERSQKQVVLLDIDIHLIKPPKACTTDDVADTYCYDALTQCIKKQTASRSFHLLEHWAYTLHCHIKSFITEPASVSVRVTKKPILGMPVAGVSVYYGDIETH